MSCFKAHADPMPTTQDMQPFTDARATLDPADPRAVFARALSLGGSVIAAVRPDQFEDPTPCTDFDVRALMGHLVAVLRRVAAMGRGDDPFQLPFMVDGVNDDAWRRTWLNAAHEAEDAWSDDGTLRRVVRLPWAELTGAETLMTYTSEVTVHTWDLASATCQRPEWEERVVQGAFEAITRVLPAGGRAEAYEAARANMPPGMPAFVAPFDEAVEVPPDSPLIDRLVAWTGRTP
jgi:uncharacterized protein (TIGR03086 family)